MYIRDEIIVLSRSSNDSFLLKYKIKKIKECPILVPQIHMINENLVNSVLDFYEDEKKKLT